MTKREKPSNGEGSSGLMSLVFDLGDETEAEAYEMARQLARGPHGRRKHVIIALLYGLSLYQKKLGMELNADTIMGLALSGSLFGDGGLAETLAVPPARPSTLEEPAVTISSAQKASADEVAENFLKSMGSLFD
jgi:hypothetical protein